MALATRCMADRVTDLALVRLSEIRIICTSSSRIHEAFATDQARPSSRQRWRAAAAPGQDARAARSCRPRSELLVRRARRRDPRRQFQGGQALAARCKCGRGFQTSLARAGTYALSRGTALAG